MQQIISRYLNYPERPELDPDGGTLFAAMKLQAKCPGIFAVRLITALGGIGTNRRFKAQQDVRKRLFIQRFVEKIT